MISYKYKYIKQKINKFLIRILFLIQSSFITSTFLLCCFTYLFVKSLVGRSPIEGDPSNMVVTLGVLATAVAIILVTEDDFHHQEEQSQGHPTDEHHQQDFVPHHFVFTSFFV